MRYNQNIAVGLIVASFFSFVYISTASAKTTTFNATVTADTLFVRSGPGTGYSKVGKLTKGATVTVYEQKNNWYRIGTGKKWVKSVYLEKTKISQATVTTASVKGAPAGCLDAVKAANAYCASIASGCPSYSTTPKCLEANQKCEDRQEIAFQQCPR